MFRHFATAGNLEKRYIGTTDEPILPVSSVSGVPKLRLYSDKSALTVPGNGRTSLPEIGSGSYRGIPGV